MEDTIMDEAFSASINDGITEAALRINSPSPPPVSSLPLPGVIPETQFDDESQHTTTVTQSTSISTPLSPNRDIKSENRKTKVEVVIHRPAAPSLPFASSRTGLVYDARMRFHAELRPRPDDVHPEDPRRIWEIYKELDEAGLIYNESIYENDDDFATQPFKLWRIPFQPADAASIALVHSPSHYEWVEELRSKSSVAREPEM